MEDKAGKKRKLSESQLQGLMCCFCQTELKQGPNSKHTHTKFPGVAGKVLSIYRRRGVTKQITWTEPQAPSFHYMEKERCAAVRKM